MHLSDLHFGRIDYGTLQPLLETALRINPDVVVVSGDLTQRARVEEFEQASTFLDALPGPQIVVPGNHDIPLHNIYRRFFRPLDRYRRFITDDLNPFYADDEVAIAGVNTARSLTVKGGRINKEQAAWAREKLCSLGSDVTRIVVTHHPFDLPEGARENDLVGRGRMAMATLANCEANVFLSGHLHLSYSGHAASRYNLAGRSVLFIQAGTATSTRGRGELNSFNVINIERPRLLIERYAWNVEINDFGVAGRETFRSGDNGWVNDRE